MEVCEFVDVWVGYDFECECVEWFGVVCVVFGFVVVVVFDWFQVVDGWDV